MAKIIHRPKPEVVVAPDYNKVLQNLKPAQQASMQARAEHEQARSRFEQSLQKAAGKGEQYNLSRGSDERAESRGNTATGAGRAAEKQTASPLLRELQSPGDHRHQPLGPTPSGSQGQFSQSKQQTEKNNQAARDTEAEAREVQIRSTQNSATSSSSYTGKNGLATTEENDGTADAGLETLACSSPLSIHELIPAGAEVAPMARAGGTSEFETIESMLNHLSLMTARYGPRDWTFGIQNENSSLLSVSMAPAANGGWNVAVTAKPEDKAEAQRHMAELEEMLEDTQLVSLNINDPAQDRTEHDRDH